MNRRFSFGVTVVLTLLMLVTLFVIVFSIALAFLPEDPDVWTYLTSIFVLWFVMEFVARYGPQPFRGPLSKIAVRIPKTRDRITLIGAFMLGWILLYTPKAARLISRADGLLIYLLFLLVSFIVFYGICFLFGTANLRSLLKIKPKNAESLARPDFPHEKSPFLLVGDEKGNTKSFDFARFDAIVYELRALGYQVSDKYWQDNGPLEFSLYWLERGDDKLALQAETQKGIKLFGPSNLLAEVQHLAGQVRPGLLE